MLDKVFASVIVVIILSLLLNGCVDIRLKNGSVHMRKKNIRSRKRMKKFISGLLAMLCVIAISGCANKQTTSTNEKEVTLVLDYLPNTNHTGIYVAQKKWIL